MAVKQSVKKILVFDISEADIKRLEKFGITYTKDPSWFPQRRRLDGVLSLLRHAKLTLPRNPRSQEITYDNEGAQVPSLDDYFEKFADRIRSAVEESCAASTVVVLNLMSLSICVTRADSIIRGLLGINAFCGTPIELVMLIRNVDSVLKSSAFQDIRNKKKLAFPFTIIDIRGYVSLFVGESYETFEVGRQPFKELLACSPKEVYRSLIFETNSYIGHFLLPNSHARTHYDLNDFIRRDDVWEYLIGFFSDRIGAAARVMILGVGMEHAVINSIGERLKVLLGDRCVLDFEYLPETNSAPASDWSDRFDMAVIVTDIVNSGTTVASVTRSLAERNIRQHAIHIFAIASMRNSPKEVEGVPIISPLEILRDYYPPDPSHCPLCQIGQPGIRVKRVEDFAAVHADQLTPFDFWEIVTDARALKKRRPDPQGRCLPFRIETTEVIRRYWMWIRNVVSFRVRQVWPNVSIDIICTVEEDGGLAFSRLVGEAIGVTKVVAVRRADLDRVTPREGPPTATASQTIRPRDRVLIVDDGINLGHTMRRLITYCQALGATPIGGIVFDNRLRQEELSVIQSLMGNNTILALYSWPAILRTL